MNVEIDRLRNEMIGMARSLDQKDDRIHHLEHRINQQILLPAPSAPQMPSDLEQMLRGDCEILKNENRMLKAKLESLVTEFDRMARQRASPDADILIH